ncbi:MAG TPA: TlpA disulfide reductase family protein, partial [Enhygromyxa sp.]|nr:TlpA disulfide reductase family protein [Enhygromyxa sp.]
FAVGEKVKGFKLPSLAGDKNISPSGYRNRVVLLNFWATWCKPCLEELPEFDRLYRKYRSHGLTLVAVTTDEDPKPVQAFVDEHKLVAKIALGGEAAASQYNRPNFPFSFVVDGDGTIVAAFDFVSDACLGDLEQVIRDSLEQLE